MKILAIETSCDETACAIVQDGTKIIANVVSSSLELHGKTGGIIPEIAAREQIKYIIPAIEKALSKKTQIQSKLLSVNCSLLSDIDALAVTIGPGLIGSLLVGVETAKAISMVTGKPIIPVNHIFAHLYANWLSENSITPPQYPAIGLVVSGGHSELFLMKNHNDFTWLGGTRDDAAGEAFDKTARLLGLPYPGGPSIAAAAATNDQRLTTNDHIHLPRPMMFEDNLDFSFSGLKTAVLREVNKLKETNKLDKEAISYLSYEIQDAITDVLIHKTLKAAQKYKVKSIILGGGVAANQCLSNKFKLSILNSQLSINLFIPQPKFCTDNAAYIASYAYFHNKPIPWQDIQAQPNLEVEV